MITAFALGAAVGTAMLVLGRSLWPRSASLLEQISLVDHLRWQASRPAPPRRSSDWPDRLGSRIAAVWTRRGWLSGRLRADLDLLGRTVEQHFAIKTVLATYGLAGGLLLALVQAGTGGSPIAPTWIGLLTGAFLFTVPDANVHALAEKRRRDFRRVLSGYLDWVASCLSGGRGVDEALHISARLSPHWALRRIAAALEDSKESWRGPWIALDELGERTGIDDLRDLAASLALAANDGARVRRSFEDRAATMREREMADMEARAGRRSLTMSLAQVPLALAFLIFLIYPALTRLQAVAG